MSLLTADDIDKEKKNILLIDDEPLLNTALCNMVSVLIERNKLSNFYKINLFFRADEVIKYLDKQQEEIDKTKLIISDYDLKDENGITGINLIEKAKSLNSIVYAIMISSSWNENPKPGSIDHYFTKPIKDLPAFEKTLIDCLR